MIPKGLHGPKTSELFDFLREGGSPSVALSIQYTLPSSLLPYRVFSGVPHGRGKAGAVRKGLGEARDPV